MRRIHECGSYFILRPKDNMKFDFLEEFTQGKNNEIRVDFVVRLAKSSSRKLYPYDLRMVRVLDTESKEYITFITDNFEISAEDIAAIYRHRWDIEVFFKWIKQNIVIKHLWGYSENAVKTHLWVAICAYLILARIKAEYKSPYSITEIATLVSVSAMAKIPLRELLDAKIDSSNQNVKDQLILFEQTCES